MSYNKNRPVALGIETVNTSFSIFSIFNNKNRPVALGIETKFLSGLLIISSIIRTDL